VPEIGLFPLPIVLVPSERIPLHIFEARYRELIDECIELGQEFGFVLATGDGAVHEIGTRARVTQVMEILDDGSMNIVVEGGERFRLLELTSGRSYTTGIVEPVLDDDDPAASTDVERALEIFTELAETTDIDVDMPDPLSPLFDFELAARVEFAVDAKQEVLAMTSPRTRMTLLIAMLETAREAIKLEQTLRERASQNGKVAPIDPDAS
jgi:Lon protease-like protein